MENLEPILAIIAAAILFSWFLAERDAEHERRMRRKWGKRWKSDWYGPR